MATLNNEEFEALLNEMQDGAAGGSGAGYEGRAPNSVVTYDLTSQDRIIRGQFPTLDAINERIASMFGTGLAGRTRLDLRVATAPAALLKFVDVNVLLAPPATISVLSLGPGYGLALAVLEGGLAEMLLDAALGNRRPRGDERAAGVATRRELTRVEQRVLQTLLEQLCAAMGECWTDIIPFSPEVQRFESDPRLCSIAPPNDVAILTTFEISGAFVGRLQLAIPYATVEPARKQLAAPPRGTSGTDERFTDTLTDELCQVNVDLSVLLGRTQLRLETLLGLNAGDVLGLDTNENDVLPVLISGRQKFVGIPRAEGHTLKIEILERRSETVAAATRSR